MSPQSDIKQFLTPNIDLLTPLLNFFGAKKKNVDWNLSKTTSYPSWKTSKIKQSHLWPWKWRLLLWWVLNQNHCIDLTQTRLKAYSWDLSMFFFDILTKIVFSCVLRLLDKLVLISTIVYGIKTTPSIHQKAWYDCINLHNRILQNKLQSSCCPKERHVKTLPCIASISN